MFASEPNSEQLLVNTEDNNFSHCESSKKWLNYQEYYHILESAENGNFLYPLYEYIYSYKLYSVMILEQMIEV